MASRRPSPTVIIRGDKDAKTITVQEVIKICQLSKFEKFVLRTSEDAERQQEKPGPKTGLLPTW